MREHFVYNESGAGFWVLLLLVILYSKNRFYDFIYQVQ
ncbi:hypothetical protein ASZ90_018552 [hydrocarbon metagenome]|uniref:Uncharacterized protein n=1 Tax=hydrocarbon metagenome TaxID=938273 RepID=A0A0W8E5S2_9ZZZZ